MSTYVTTTTVIRARAAQLSRAVAAYLRSEGALMDSQTFTAATTCNLPIGSTALDAMTARFDAVRNLPGAVGLLEGTNPHGLAAAHLTQEQALQASSAGLLEEADRLARQAVIQLATAALPALNRIQVGERTFTDETVGASLSRLGYNVRRAEGERSVGYYAERGHHAVAVRVNDGGTLELDVAGLAGGGCETVVAELKAELATRGLECDIVSTQRHGDDRGGTLIRRAARANPSDIAAGIVARQPKAVETERVDTASPTIRQGIR